ncbi:hypothetical protein LCM19_13080 [Qipengyuania flava]|nr:hypothetical protein [Qipengyuania flava]
MTDSINRDSATKIADPLATKELEHAFFEGLRELWKECGHGTNKHDQARILIMACIDEGVNNGKRIVGILSKIGFNARHIGATLDRQCGSNPDHDWWKDNEGNYRLHQNAAQLEAASIVI